MPSSPVTLRAWPDAECKVHPFGDSTGALDLFADELGVVRFVAAHTTPSDEVTALSLDCHDDTGRSETYTLDLTTPRTFDPLPPIPPEQWPPGALRPALSGDPLAYSQDELHAMGFPRRPDPITQPEKYGNWLAAASKPTRRSLAKGHPAPPGTAMSTNSAPAWAGPLFSAKQCTYGSGCNIWDCIPHNGGCETFYDINAEWYLPSISLTANGDLGQWVGLGGNYDLSTPCLIQDGFQSYYSWLFQYYMSYNMFVEVFSGTNKADAGGYGIPEQYFAVNPGDHVYVEAWACDSNGYYSVSGGYGCFFIEDFTLNNGYGQILGCNSPSGNPCPSLPLVNAYSGQSAEMEIEKNVPNLPQFSQFQVSYVASAQEDNGPDVTYTNSNDAANVTGLYLQSQSFPFRTLADSTVNYSGDTATIKWDNNN
jgi:hypothetical protein